MRSVLLLSLLATCATDLLAQTESMVVRLSPDDPVMARLDDLAALPWIQRSAFTTDTAAHNVHGFAAEQVPAWSERDVQHRLAVLDERTPFNLIYNKPVQAYIDLYAVRKREMTSRMLGLAELYFPLFEEHLDRYGIPLEMKYLAVVESALNPAARSRAGAVGLWQFMLPTGKLYGLKADSYVDERHDVYKSTDAACRYLKYLHHLYGNWELALAAYNCGPGNVNKAIRRSGGVKDYWKIYDHLPRETRGYVPAFIAVNYIFSHHADYNLYPIAPAYCAYEVDTVQVCYPLDLAAVAVLTGGTVQELRELNPTFKLGIVPDVDQPVSIYLPKDAAGVFVSNEETMRYSYQAAGAAATPAQAATPIATEVAEQKHTVRSGESLGSIAHKYGTSVSELKRLNGMRNDMIHPGQKLVVKRTNAPASERTATAEPRSDNGALYHVVQPGDTLWSIAQRYQGVSVEDLRRLNAAVEREGLKPGSRLTVRVPNG
ncbi:MAG: LysM peptidoglycan-binding domain-containing protein [Flavobacteriales bacterium]|nr:LysM peptidoglycan-binding domain-containing protein [Flavobacteriales bacterium]